MNNKVPTNCCNCGAVMQYSTQHYGGMYKCPYCGTEHHIDLLGRIEEYKVKLMWQGHLIEAWLETIEFEPQYDEYITIDGMYKRYMAGGSPRLTLTLTGYVVDEPIKR